MQNQQSGGGKFVERFEMAVMEFVILEKAMQGNLTRQNLEQTFKGNLQMKYDHLDHCVNRLVQENHLKKEGDSYKITDDGREDVQEIQRLAMEIPNVVNQGQGGQQRQGMTQQQTTGGVQGGGGMQGGGTNQGSTTSPTNPNMAGQPKGGPGNASSTTGGNVGGTQNKNR